MQMAMFIVPPYLSESDLKCWFHLARVCIAIIIPITFLRGQTYIGLSISILHSASL